MRRPRLTSWESKQLWLSDAVAAQLISEADQHFPLETGGLLVGYRSGAHFVVRALVGPGPKATRTETSFTPDAVWQERQLADVYAGSGRVFSYLGDWHTHPHGDPVPSHKDGSTLKTISRHRPSRLRRPAMLILGGQEGKWQMKTWTLNKFAQSPVEIVTTTYRQAF